MRKRGYTNAKPGNALVLAQNNGQLTGVIASWQFSTSTTASDPGDGYVRFNNAAPASVTAIYIDNLDGQDNNLAAWLDTLTAGAQIAFRSANSLTQFVIYTVVSVTDSTGYRTVAVTWLAGLPAFLADEALALAVSLAGDSAFDDAVDANHIEPTTVYSNEGTRLSIKDGSSSTPVTNNDPVAYLQKYVSLDNEGDPFAHNVGVMLGETIIRGGTGADENEGTWISILGNTVAEGANEGTEASPDYDLKGNVIGVAGFARTEKPNNGIVTALWGYGSTPEVTDTEFDASPFNWTVCGQEINIDIRHKDPGAKTVVSGKGTTVGDYLFNFRAPGAGVRDWSFGVALNGSPDDNNYSSTNVDNFNGFHVGLLIDKIKAAGIRFGQYFKNGSYGIRFPDSYAGSQEPAAAIHLGNSKLQMGGYTGATFANGDFWRTGNDLKYRTNGVTETVLTERGTLIELGANREFSTPNGNQFAIGDTGSSVNFLSAYGGAAGSAPALIAAGSDTDVGASIITKGAGLFAVIANGAIQFVSGAVASAVNYLGISGAVASSTPSINAVGSDTNIGVRLRAKGSGVVSVSPQAAALPTPPTGTVLHVGGADGSIARILLDVFGNNPIFNYRRANGTMASPSAVASGDQLLNFGAFGYGATGYSALARVAFVGTAAENWTDTAQGTNFVIQTTTNGTTTNTERLRVKDTGEISHQANARVLFDANSHLQLRSYTVATLPSAATSAQMIFVSDETGGSIPAFSDGTNWRRVSDRAIVS